ncbi:hypothetical protein HPP92_018771 [Vanilla planifolia]|uniref:Uncharacterized protein n=1 Tax=Vanilla planifolia TaxID=51239 RepID=A0A835QAH8_VANPL|nr:hypothetical protein HPP92_018771 [Vanilla planifolia]
MKHIKHVEGRTNRNPSCMRLLLRVDVVCMGNQCSPHQALVFPNSIAAHLHLLFSTVSIYRLDLLFRVSPRCVANEDGKEDQGEQKQTGRLRHGCGCFSGALRW